MYQSYREQVIERLRLLPFAPSVGMQEMPRESLGAHLGFKGHKQDRPELVDELDEKLGSMYLDLFIQQIVLKAQ